MKYEELSDKGREAQKRYSDLSQHVKLANYDHAYNTLLKENPDKFPAWFKWEWKDKPSAGDFELTDHQNTDNLHNISVSSCGRLVFVDNDGNIFMYLEKREYDKKEKTNEE